MEAQPLIRYRTGDWTRIIPGRCLCGSEIKRLDFVKRMDPLGSIREMDELLFEIPELIDYCVKIVDGKKEITALFTSVPHPPSAGGNPHPAGVPGGVAFIDPDLREK